MNRDAEIIQMAKDGHPPREISVAIGVRRAKVYDVLGYARKRGENIPRAKAGSGRPAGFSYVSIPTRMLDRLEGPAARRGISARDLATDILQTVIAAKLVSAILDDDEAEAPNEH